MTDPIAEAKRRHKKKKDGRRAKGNYYVARTMMWMRALGFAVESTENKRAIPKFDDAGRITHFVYVTRDLWGSDLIARNAKRLIFIQVKSNRGHIAAGKHELSRGPWPNARGIIERWVVLWPPGRRIDKGPEIHEV